MTNKNRYERRADGTVEDTKAGENPNIAQPREEIVTGIPATENVPAGSPQFAAFVEAEREASDKRLGRTDPEPMEARDNRGVDTEGKKRLPIHEIDELASEMAGRFANGVENVRSELDGDTLTVRITTRHGTARGSAKVDDWTAAGVKKALADIEKQMNGDVPSGDNTDPDKKLADAVRAAAKA